MTSSYVKRSAKIYARIRLWGSLGFMLMAVIAGEIIERYSSQAFTWVSLAILLVLMLSTLCLKQPRFTQPQSQRNGSFFDKSLGSVDLSRLLLQPFVWYLYKAEYVTCSWLLEHTITQYKYQTSAAIRFI
jgi:PPP family 3-phenylpropionic acid transporter